MYNDYGFFRDLYLFRAGVKLNPAEIWQISQSVEALQHMARIRHPDQIMVEYGHPEPIALFFPEFLMGPACDGLSNLREVASPPRGKTDPIQVEVIAHAPVSLDRPLRHFGT
jgi:hypothetical protein